MRIDANARIYRLNNFQRNVTSHMRQWYWCLYPQEGNWLITHILCHIGICAYSLLRILRKRQSQAIYENSLTSQNIICFCSHKLSLFSKNKLYMLHQFSVPDRNISSTGLLSTERLMDLSLWLSGPW